MWSLPLGREPDWYFGLDGRPGDDEFDFVSIVSHELAHGLGFFDSFVVEDGEAEYGLDDNIPTIFDAFIYDKELNLLISDDAYTNSSPELHDAITAIKLFWGPGGDTNSRGEPVTVSAANGGGPVMLWAPEEFSEGNSISHLDEDAYPSGTPTALMSPFVSRGQVTPQPGPVLLAMLHDMGYTIRELASALPVSVAAQSCGPPSPRCGAAATSVPESRYVMLRSGSNRLS